MKKVLICGRGKSLKEINNPILQQEFEHVILINAFNDFVRHDPNTRDFLKNKKIIQFLNSTETGLDRQFLSDYNIEKIYSSRLEPNGASFWWRQPRKRKVPESFGRKCFHPSDKLEDFMAEVKNTSATAILLSLLDLGADEVYFIGIDFYEVGYHLNHNTADYLNNKKRHEEVHCKEIKLNHESIISKFPEKNFYYVTHSTFDPQLKNCKIVKI